MIVWSMKKSDVQDDVPKCLVLSTAQKYSVYCQRGVKKAENIHIEEAEIWTFALKNDLSVIKIDVD